MWVPGLTQCPNGRATPSKPQVPDRKASILGGGLGMGAFDRGKNSTPQTRERTGELGGGPSGRHKGTKNKSVLESLLKMKF